MKAPTEKFLELQLGAAEIRVPHEAAVLAYLEREMDMRRPIGQPISEPLNAIVEFAGVSIGAPRRGGVYAGVTVYENQPHHLILLPNEATDVTWQQAKDWAAEQGGMLPARFDQLVLFQHLKKEFAEEVYWSADEYAGDGEYAWYQFFGDGNQYYWHKVGKGRARAVRRVTI